LSSTAKASRKRLDKHQAQRDLDKLYWKLGKEVVALARSGEIDHPGLQQRAQRIEEQLTKIAGNEDGRGD
jgi:hypothetical protein